MLVSHDKDFDMIAPRIPKGSRARFRKLSRIHLDCSEVQAAHRVRATIRMIELAHDIARENGKSMRVIVQKTAVRVAD